jgi:ArsR family transcriptional regulator
MKLISSRHRNSKDIHLKLASFLETIGVENRLKILCLLKQQKRCVCEICQLLKLPQNLISHHLKVLKNYDLLFSEKEGVKIFYSLNQKVLSRHLKLFNKIFNQ